ncbi:MAG: dephospho-CoA kinase [Clostridia bacterium]|nr:dephospho-CoA kinase [Clostridia bacterium]
MVIGITGGSGCGTSSVGKILENNGWGFIDCDAVYHELLSEDQNLKNDLVARFGSGILTSNGFIDRKALGSIVFADEKALLDLNGITHGYITEKVIELISESEKIDIAIEAVELLESGMKTLCAGVVGILADKEIRISRIMSRDSISRENAVKRIDAQRSDEYYRSNCTCCIENNGTFEELASNVLALIKEIDTERFNTIAH